jgi:hypothetical protein
MSARAKPQGGSGGRRDAMRRSWCCGKTGQRRGVQCASALLCCRWYTRAQMAAPSKANLAMQSGADYTAELRGIRALQGQGKAVRCRR